MKTILFCQNPYAFGILEPLMQVLKEKNYKYIWFVKGELKEKFPLKNERHTNDIEIIKDFSSDVIFVPGNEVPHYLRGLKVQVFHGLAGEKKGHFRIRNYFDLYLTQGPFFTRGFQKLRAKHKNFDVIETGWPKLDVYGKDRQKYDADKERLKEKYKVDKILLYAPTFSPSLTSAPFLIEEFRKLSNQKNYLILFKFHDLMSQELIADYKKLATDIDNVIFEEEKNIIKFLLMADIMISDTSSVVYEFLLLNKPVITFNCSSKNIQWEDSNQYSELANLVERNLKEDPFLKERKNIMAEYHPYNDGDSAMRMVEETEKYIKENGVPEKRKLAFLRRRKIYKIFGR